MANESEQYVWFDDIEIRHTQDLVVQENHYDPWGMELVGIQKAGTPEDEWKFQGKEQVSDVGLEWSDFSARYYDPQLGRWHAADPADQFASPYLAMGNNPVVGVDPDGQWVHIAIGAVIGGVSGYQIGRAQGAKGWGLFGYTLAGAGIGALSGGAAAGVTASGGSVVAAGAVAGGVNGYGMATLSGGDAFSGAWKGAVVGAVGGAFSQLGTGVLAESVGYGMLGGGVTGGLEAALNGRNIGRGIAVGAAAGGVYGLLASDNTKNLIRGRGFRSNNAILREFVNAGNYNEALNYFGFEGTYRPGNGPDYVIDGEGFFGATSTITGEISYGAAAFTSFDNLRETYTKELYTSQRVRNGTSTALKGRDIAGEEAAGWVSPFLVES